MNCEYHFDKVNERNVVNGSSSSYPPVVVWMCNFQKKHQTHYAYFCCPLQTSGVCPHEENGVKGPFPVAGF